MARKKSKQTILFPPYLDMHQFLRPTDVARLSDPGESDEELRKNNHLYELRGVLLHKGTSAYHGHYEAQVYDIRCALFFRPAWHSVLTRLLLMTVRRNGISSMTNPLRRCLLSMHRKGTRVQTPNLFLATQRAKLSKDISSFAPLTVLQGN